MKCQQQFCILEARFSGSRSKPHLGAARTPPGVGPRGVGEARLDVAVAAGVARVVARVVVRLEGEEVGARRLS